MGKADAPIKVGGGARAAPLRETQTRAEPPQSECKALEIERILVKCFALLSRE